VVDWDLRTNLEGLYAAGGAVFGAGAHSSAAASGRYAGRSAALYALGATDPLVDDGQAAREKSRVYAPLAARGRPMGWKEFNAGIGRVMQSCCGHYRSEGGLLEGQRLLQEIRESEAESASAANPHELMRVVECLAMIDVGEAVMQASLARKASSDYLAFRRIDYPAIDPPEWRTLMPIRLGPSGPVVRELPFDYYLRAPYAPSLEANYAAHCGLPVES
jgi:succinate dehydrogenase/fumarate reductase flavoprotein subunit